MKSITIFSLLICILTGCVLIDSPSKATTGTIGDVSINDGKLELAINRDSHQIAIVDLFASDNTGAAKVSLMLENINKLHGMLDAALNQPLSADTQDKFTTLGVIQSRERSGLVLSAAQRKGERTFRLVAVGVYGIPQLHFDISQDELKELDRLLLKGITELNKELPASASQGQSK